MVVALQIHFLRIPNVLEAETFQVAYGMIHPKYFLMEVVGSSFRLP